MGAVKYTSLSVEKFFPEDHPALIGAGAKYQRRHHNQIAALHSHDHGREGRVGAVSDRAVMRLGLQPDELDQPGS